MALTNSSTQFWEFIWIHFPSQSRQHLSFHALQDTEDLAAPPVPPQPLPPPVPHPPVEPALPMVSQLVGELMGRVASSGDEEEGGRGLMG